MRRGFPSAHPLVAGEIPIHPELLGHLHFDVPSRTTLPLGPDDFRRFLPEMQRAGMRSAFPLSASDLVALQQQQQQQLAESSKIRRQKSHKETSSAAAFASLPHEALTASGGKNLAHGGKLRRPQNRSQSTDPREKSRFRPLSMFQPFGGGGAGWFNPGYVWREAGPELTGRGYSKTEAASRQQQQ